MSKNLFAFVTFGLTEFSKLAVQSIRDTVTNEYDIFAIAGKPGDEETANWLSQEGIPYKIHTENKGFPYSLNDIYDYAWKFNDYDNLIIMGNDVILYPYAGDSLINLANESEYEVISALQYDVRDLVREFPETVKNFSGESLVITNFDSKPWQNFKGYSQEYQLADMQLFDIQNLCLYKRAVFDKIGYTDVNFYPAYFVDNDYARRIVKAGIKCCSLVNARFFHFWSRVLKQGDGGSNNSYFNANSLYYRHKWGGDFGRETLTPDIKISSREDEDSIINYWR